MPDTKHVLIVMTLDDPPRRASSSAPFDPVHSLDELSIHGTHADAAARLDEMVRTGELGDDLAEEHHRFVLERDSEAMQADYPEGSGPCATRPEDRLEALVDLLLVHGAKAVVETASCPTPKAHVQEEESPHDE